MHEMGTPVTIDGEVGVIMGWSKTNGEVDAYTVHFDRECDCHGDFHEITVTPEEAALALVEEEEWDWAPEVGTWVEIHNGQGGEEGVIYAYQIGADELLYRVQVDGGYMLLSRDQFTPIDD